MLSTIQFEGRVSSRYLFGIIVCKFSSRKIFVPIVLFIRGIDMQHLLKCLIHMLCLPICLRMKCGRYGIFVPKCLKTLCQNLLVNFESQSDTITLGSPWFRKIVIKKNFATSRAVADICIGWQCALLESRSTNTTMASCPCLVKGNCTIKSMVTSSHLLPGVGRGCSNPAGIWLFGLFLWQMSHVCIYRWISFPIFGQ